MKNRKEKKRSCKKRWFPSRESAENVIPELEALSLSKTAASRKKGKLHAYRCRWCRKWHLGHEKSKDELAKIREFHND